MWLLLPDEETEALKEGGNCSGPRPVAAEAGPTSLLSAWFCSHHTKPSSVWGRGQAGPFPGLVAPSILPRAVSHWASWLPGMVGEALHFQLAQVGFSAQILNEVRDQLSTRQARHGAGPSNTQGLGALGHRAALPPGHASEGATLGQPNLEP